MEVRWKQHSANGLLRAVNVRFQFGADVDLAGGYWGGVLQAATDYAQDEAEDGDGEIVLAHNVNVNLTNSVQHSAVIAASNQFQLSAYRSIPSAGRA